MTKWKTVLQTSEELFRLKRAAVLREANRIMGRQGFHNTSLEDVASALAVSKGTLYNYVSDKQEILFECHMMALDIGERAIQFAHDHGTSGFSKLQLMIRAYVTWMNSLMGGGAMSEIGALRAADQKTVIARRDRSDAELSAFIDEGQKDGSMRAVDPKIALFTIMGAVNMIPTWFSPKGRLSPGEIATAMMDIFAGGLQTGVVTTTMAIPDFVSGDAAGEWRLAGITSQTRRQPGRPRKEAAGARPKHGQQAPSNPGRRPKPR